MERPEKKFVPCEIWGLLRWFVIKKMIRRFLRSTNFKVWVLQTNYCPFNVTSLFLTEYRHYVNSSLLSMEPFAGTHGCGSKRHPLNEMSNTYPTMIKLPTVMLYLKKIQRNFKSCVASFKICWHQLFFTEK